MNRQVRHRRGAASVSVVRQVYTPGVSVEIRVSESFCVSPVLTPNSLPQFSITDFQLMT
jgi:hypothetical protein